jgi:hypothetical protein
VFEAKDSRLEAEAIEELDAARRSAQADFAVLVVAETRTGSRPRCTACASTAGTSSWCLRPARGLDAVARGRLLAGPRRVLMARGEAEGIDASAIREAIERATGAMGDVLRVKQQLTGAKTSIERAPTSSTPSPPRCGRSSSTSSCCWPRPTRTRRRLPPIAAVPAPRPQVVREPDPPYPGAERLPF